MQKIKQFIEEKILSEKGKDILVILIVILVGLGSFELGRLSKEDGKSGINIEYPNNQESNPNSIIQPISFEKNNFNQNKNIITANISGQNFFASKKGKKYYTLGCSSGKTIKEINRIYFNTSDQAESAGYVLSSSCNY